MCASGRLRKADIECHQVILHSQRWAVNLFPEEMQKTWHHEGVEYLRSIAQQKLSIFGFRIVPRSVKHDCVQCKILT